MGPIRVYVVAQFEALRMGLASLIEVQPNMTRAGEASNLQEMAGDDAFREADLILADIKALNRTNIEEFYRLLGEWFPGMHILFFGSEQDARGLNPEDIRGYLDINAVGFLLTDGATERLIEAIQLVAAGTFVCECDMGVVRLLLTALGQPVRYQAQESQAELSEREVDVLRLVAQGLSNRQIAERLFLSEGTVKIHVSHIMSKLELERRTELVRYALSRGLVPLEQWSG